MALLGLVACQSPERLAIPLGALDGASTAILELTREDHSIETLTFDPRAEAPLDWVQSVDPEAMTRLLLYGCSAEALARPVAPSPQARTCLPETGRRYRLGGSSGPWIPDDGPTALPVCTRCEQFPLVPAGVVSSRDYEESLHIMSAVILDDNTVLLSANQERDAGIVYRHSFWVAERGASPGVRELEVVPAAPMNGPDLADTVLVGDKIVGVGDHGVYEVRVDGDQVHFILDGPQPEPAQEIEGDCKIILGSVADELYVAGNAGALFRRRAGQWARLVPPRTAPSPGMRVDSYVDLALFGPDGVLALGVTTSSTSYAFRENNGVLVTAYHLHQGDMGRDWPMPGRETVASVATLASRGYVLGINGGLYEVTSRGAGEVISDPTAPVFKLLRGLDDRLLIGGRYGNIMQVFPDRKTICPAELTANPREIVSKGDTVVQVGIDGLEISWYRATPVVECSLDGL